MSARACALGRAAVFAGTTEGHELLRRLSEAGMGATAFVATEYGRDVMGPLPGVDVRVGRLDESEMERVLAGFDVVVDVTHPYAACVSANVARACDAAGVRRVRLLRPASASGADETLAGVRVVRVPDAAGAVRFLAGVEGCALLTTGSKDLPTFAHLPGFERRLWARILPDAANLARARELGFPAGHLICMQGPFPREMNVATLHMTRARWMVTKDSGAPGGMPEKLAAARDAGVGLVVLERPAEPGGGMTFDEVLALLTRGA